MNTMAKSILSQVKQRLLTEYAQVHGSHVSKRISVDPLSDVSFLRLNAGSIDVRRTNPFCESFVPLFEGALADHPEWNGDPDMVLQWFDECAYRWDEDLLGSYCLGPKPVIDLYWLSIILCARKHGWLISDLVLVVLIHEWAHAFADRGLDADGVGSKSSLRDRNVCEGVAQYWTHYALHNAPEGAKAFSVFLSLCKVQLSPYHAHIPWLHPDFIKRYEELGISVRPSCLCSLGSGVAGTIHEPFRQTVRLLRSDKTWSGLIGDFDERVKNSIEDLNLSIF